MGCILLVEVQLLPDFQREGPQLVDAFFEIEPAMTGGVDRRDDVAEDCEVEVVRKDPVVRQRIVAVKRIDIRNEQDQIAVVSAGFVSQRVGVARALAGDPDVILMDEPFGAIDAITRTGLQDEMLKLQRQLRKTIVFVTHDVEEAILLANRIIIFSSRPARIVKQIVVDDLISIDDRRSGDMNPQMLFDLRREIHDIISAQYSGTTEAN